VLLGRIQNRARDMEAGISEEYLTLLDTFYEDWVKTFDICPVLTIRTDNLDFVHKPEHLDIVVSRIQEKLSGKDEVIFPTSK
jgi:deoxyadenosine/deoxycytidine kinase